MSRGDGACLEFVMLNHLVIRRGGKGDFQDACRRLHGNGGVVGEYGRGIGEVYVVGIIGEKVWFVFEIRRRNVDLFFYHTSCFEVDAR